MHSIGRRIIAALLCAAIVIFAAGCSTSEPSPNGRFVTVVVESSADYTCTDSIVRAHKNADAVIRFYIGADYAFAGINYSDYDFTQAQQETATLVTVTLRAVRYSIVVTPRIKRAQSDENDDDYEYDDKNDGFDERLTDGAGDGIVAYCANDGTVAVKYAFMSDAHLRFNTLTAKHAFTRRGYVQTGWNTAADGSGAHIGFGSRCDRDGTNDLKLYADWARACDEEHFTYSIKNGKATVTGYSGEDTDLVIPRTLGGARVARIASGAVTGGAFDKIVLPDTVRRVDNGAFCGVTAEKLYLFDNYDFFDGKAFTDCEFVTLYINAARAPAYSGTYFDIFADKCDRLITLADRKKIILAAGSSTRFGLDSAALDSAFYGYDIVNMGVYAYANMLPEYLIILSYAQAGDIMLSTPEFDTIETQFCTTTDVDHVIFAMVEANYDLFSRIDCRLITDTFTAFSHHIAMRRGQYLSYDITAYDYDEDGAPIDTPAYNEYGDYILPRPNNEEFKLFGIRRACYNIDYFPLKYIQSLNSVYKLFTDKGVTVLFEYSPRSEFSITEDSDSFTITALGVYLTEKLQAPVIGRIEDSLMNAYYFFGTDNHLSDDGVQIYTSRVIDDIKNYAMQNQAEE